ncbi:dehydrogenase [Sphingobium jiangsuense]|uniref:Ketoreductase domain-containing protein n=1 Tax=Sphingobium jiangsuense TaxID=870476 RepID=A0A7W6BI02_9SPHN|nr:SDR family oxidoreductase [Sphingobium jiangsuense]MBB3927376.1 hypothetical protein [Sphingobium jiangsuense]GLT00778.1 dehydrogenase [Sphingobium jiangsuense]
MAEQGKILVTGASSGIGAAYAEELARRGRDLLLVARRVDRLRALAARLEEAHGVAVELFPADLADPADLRRVEARIEAGGDVDFLINNAGIGDISLFVEQQRDTHERMIAVNVLALTRLTHAAIPAMLARGGGTVINIASGFAFDFMPGASVYAATKAFVVQFTHVLDAELASQGLRFQALVPGLTRTGLGGAEESGFFDQFPPEMVMDPAVLVKASLAGLELSELVCLPRLADPADHDRAHAAMRAVGKTPPHNHVAERYQLDAENA